MALLSNPHVAAVVAKVLQRLTAAAAERRRTQRAALYPQHVVRTEAFEIPTSVKPAKVVLYRANGGGVRPVHVNFHGGGFVLALVDDDDAQCRFLAATANINVINVDYVVAPQHPFPQPTQQAFEVVQWVANQGVTRGWHGGQLTIGGQSAGGSLAAAVARQALEQRGPAIAMQVLHYPPLDLVTPAGAKRATIDKPMLRPWMGNVFDAAYVPDVARRADRLVSPAHPVDTADLTGIAPALVITAEYDLLRAEGDRYARRLAAAGALRQHVVVPQADHGYDLSRHAKTDEMYALISRHLAQTFTHTETSSEPVAAP